MANFTVSGIDEVEAAFRKTAEVPDDVKSNILQRMAQVASTAQARSAVAMGVYDPESTVHIAEKIKVNKPKITDNGGSVTITFSGTRKRGNKRVRNAEIAFINEFGKRGQPARPFIKSANDKNAAKINEAGQEALDEWLAEVNK